jgi:sensor domain CHASE-containing protein
MSKKKELQSTMKLRPKIFMLLICVIIIPLVLVISYTYIDIKTSITNIEIDKGKSHISNANKFIDLMVSQHGESYLTWTSWTDYFDAVERKDIAWINENIMSSVEEDTNNEVLISFDINGKILVESTVPSDWKDLDLQSFELFKKLGKGINYASGIIKTSDGLYITSLTKLVKSEDLDFQNPNGYTIYAKKLKEDLLEQGHRFFQRVDLLLHGFGGFCVLLTSSRH